MNNTPSPTRSKRWKTGAIAGKFLPPHRGHSHLIQTALAQVEQLTVIVCEREGEFLSGELRASWLRELFPTAQIMVIEDRYDENDSALWARLAIGWLGGAPDVVFSSEHYGTKWAGFMGCEHVLVDLNRETVPISATKVRADMALNWEYLEAPVRAHFAKRIVVLGAESTGTTTLAEDLARYFQTACVLEYGREYSIEKLARGEFDADNWASDEFLAIAKEQAHREDEAARSGGPLLICDTDAFATRLWHWRYCGFFSPELDELVQARRPPALYLLTDVDIPFVQDGTRDGEHIRREMHEKFIEELIRQSAPWQLAAGTREERSQQAGMLVEAVLLAGEIR